MNLFIDITAYLLLAGAAAFGLNSTQIATAQTDTAKTFFQLADSISAVNQSTKELHAITARKIDSVEMLNAYLRQVLASHDYRVYRYTNPRIKLVYKWQKGTPGHWELIKKIHY